MQYDYDYDRANSIYDLMEKINHRIRPDTRLLQIVCNPRSLTQEEEFYAIYENPKQLK